MTPISTTQVLAALLDTSGLTIEAEPSWFPKAGGDGIEGEAQAVIVVNERRYAISLEPLP